MSLFWHLSIVGAFGCILFSLFLQVLSSTRIALYIRQKESWITAPNDALLKIVAIDTGAGVVQVNPQFGGLSLCRIPVGVEVNDKTVSAYQ